MRIRDSDEAVKTTDELKETAKQIRTNVETNAQNYASSYQMSSEEYITTMLNQQGYEYEQLDDFCLLAAKMQKMQNDYIDKNFDSLFDDYYKEKQPRTVSHILIKVADVNNPSEEEQKQIDAVNKELKEGKSFEEVAKKYSADGSAENGGSLGLMDTEDVYKRQIEIHVPFAYGSAKIHAGYFILTPEPIFPSIHSILPFSNTFARFVTRFTILSLQFCTVE